MTLSSHLLDQMASFREGSMPPPHMMPLQTPTNVRTPYQADYTPSILNGNDGSQFRAHHGMSPWGMSQGYMPTPGPGRFTPFSEEKVAALQVRLAKKLGPEYITQRPGPGGGPKLSYVEGWKVVNLANEVFGFNGWSSSIIRLQTDFLDVDANDRCKVGITAIIRITLQDGCYHEDIGYGQAENVRGKATALEKAQKEAVTDGIKRALKHFGNVLGNCLYDRDFTKEVQKIRVGPAKFNVDDLERRPEFTPKGAPRAASAVPQHVSGNAKTHMPPPAAPSVHSEPVRAREETPLRSVDETAPFDDDDSAYAFLETELEGFDESVLGARVTGDVPMLDARDVKSNPAPASATGAPSTSGAPAYQHRHRPEAEAGPSTSSSAASVASASEDVARRRVGGFAMPNGSSSSSASTSAAAMRAAAIKASFRNGPTTSINSPRIPSGGIDSIAARASSNLHVHGANLDIENMGPGPIDGGFKFESARGVKRDGSLSPTKNGRPRPGGPRAALGDIALDADEWQAKRSRVT